MVEFAILLPLLIVLTVGGIFLTMSFIHKSRLNGIAFMSARMASVRENPMTAAEFIRKKYQDKTGQRWLDNVQVKEAVRQGGRVVVQMIKPGERLDILANAIDIISGGGHYDPRNITSQMVLSSEYLDRLAGPRPETATAVDYQTSSVLDKLLTLPEPIAKLLPIDMTPMADKGKDDAEKDKILSTQPPNNALKRFYTNKLNFDQNSEEPGAQFVKMQTIGAHFKEIETAVGAGQSVISLLENMIGIGEVSSIINQIGEEVAQVGEQALSAGSKAIDTNNRLSFGGTSLVP